MRKPFLAVAAAFSLVSATAQTEQHSSVVSPDGGSVYLFQATSIEGTPFLKSDWMNATVIKKDGTELKNVSLRFDVYNNAFVFNRHDSSFVVGPDIKAIRLYPEPGNESSSMVFKKGYPIAVKFRADKYVQVLAEGKDISLIKANSKNLEDYNEYGTATRLQRFNDMQQYYIVKGNESTAVSLNRKTLETVLEPKWKDMEPFLKQTNNSGKGEKEWAAAIDHYNSL
jgi:hypothetical protein